MFKKLRDIFVPDESSDGSSTSEETLRAAVAVLLAEIAQADHEHADSETLAIKNQLASYFSLGEGEAADLANAAIATAAESVSLHDFTRTLHEQLDYADKQTIIEMLWRIAYADRNLDKYEDYMIGKIAELLYVYRADVLRIKHRISSEER